MIRGKCLKQIYVKWFIESETPKQNFLWPQAEASQLFRNWYGDSVFLSCFPCRNAFSVHADWCSQAICLNRMYEFLLTFARNRERGPGAIRMKFCTSGIRLNSQCGHSCILYSPHVVLDWAQYALSALPASVPLDHPHACLETDSDVSRAQLFHSLVYVIFPWLCRKRPHVLILAQNGETLM